MKPAFEWQQDKLVLLDQRKLPWEETYVVCHDHEEVGRAVKDMVVRGAPAIGVVAAFGVVLGMMKSRDDYPLPLSFQAIVAALSRTRPTARNLFWALERMRAAFTAVEKLEKKAVVARLLEEALAIEAEDIATNKKIGANGAPLIPEGATVLTHCNAGELATAGYGTALGVIRKAAESGKNVRVIACETRPFLQGARLTCWELRRLNIPVTLITDNMAGWLMQRGEIQLVITGADRIARNGDTANKIGTYSLAVLARENRIPFYVAAPFSTIDLSLESGAEIPIEERPEDEVRRVANFLVTLPDIPVRNPAFDVTPHRLISGIITEKGIAYPPYEKSFTELSHE